MPRTPDDMLYLSRLQDYYARQRSLPSYAKLAEVLRVAAKSAVKKVLERLAAQGFLERSSHGVWVPAPRFFDRPLALTPVPAGLPISANDVHAEPFAIDTYLVDTPTHTSLVPVVGDSMLDAGIHHGDIAVVERRSHADPGDLVVAAVDGAFTLKKLALEEGRPVLLPANPAYPILRPTGELLLFGVVVGLIRKYRR